ncbi:hypothetical protein KGQ34_00710 [Patescibacteria group bacterium]|nr:hypothetical protein [Patescibacteria group bacterium]
MMDDSNKQRIRSELESKKRDFENRKSSNDYQLKQLYRILEGGKSLNGSEEYTKNRLEKENDEYDKKIEDAEKAILQLR